MLTLGSDLLVANFTLGSIGLLSCQRLEASLASAMKPYPKEGIIYMAYSGVRVRWHVRMTSKKQNTSYGTWEATWYEHATDTQRSASAGSPCLRLVLLRHVDGVSISQPKGGRRFARGTIQDPLAGLASGGIAASDFDARGV